MVRHTIKQNRWGDQLPMIVSRVIWRQTAPETEPPGNQTYLEWLDCQCLFTYLRIYVFTYLSVSGHGMVGV